MQEGAGVSEVIEDELRKLGTRLKDLDVRLELGLQESVKSAVEAGYGVTFISQAAVEAGLRPAGSPQLACVGWSRRQISLVAKRLGSALSPVRRSSTSQARV